MRSPFTRPGTDTIPGLDGLRALSVLCVVYGHLLWVPSFPFKGLVGILNPATLGVNVFFVISGFLITTILLKEKDGTGRVWLGRFYLRRSLRIFPAYYAFLMCVFLLAFAGVIALERSDYLYTLTYTFNLKGNQATWWVGHTWSLAVEEQFYLLWPLCVSRLRTSTLIRIAVGFIAAGPVCRALLLLAPAPFADHWSLALPAVGDPIAVGALVALLRADPVRRRSLEAVCRQRWVACAPVLAALPVSLAHRPNFFPHPFLLATWLSVMSSVSIGLFVARITFVSNGPIQRVLGLRTLTAMGVASYSIYLWQMLFLGPVDVPLLRFPLNLVWLAAVSVVSFLCIERPFNQLRDRLERRVFAKSDSVRASNLRNPPNPSNPSNLPNPI